VRGYSLLHAMRLRRAEPAEGKGAEPGAD